MYFLTQVERLEGGELISDSKLKLEIAEAKIDMLAFVCNLLGGMGVDLNELDAEAGHKPPPAHAHGKSAAPNPSALVQELSATSAAASSSEAVPLQKKCRYQCSGPGQNAGICCCAGCSGLG